MLKYWNYLNNRNEKLHIKKLQDGYHNNYYNRIADSNHIIV